MEVQQNKRQRILTNYQIQISEYIRDVGIFNDKFIEIQIAMMLDGVQTFENDILGSEFFKYILKMSHCAKEFLKM